MTALTVGLALTLSLAVLLVFLLVVLRQRQRAAVTMNEARIAKETFSHTLGIVCHELRNPVHALKGILTIGVEDGDGSGCLPASDVGVALDCVNIIQAVLDDVLEMQRTDVVRPGAFGWRCKSAYLVCFRAGCCLLFRLACTCTRRKQTCMQLSEMLPIVAATA
jgi:hypothetical protein